MRIAIIIACSALLVLACSDGDGATTPTKTSEVAAKAERVRVPKLFPKLALEILAAPESFELVTLHPQNDTKFDPATDPRPFLYGFPITSRAEVTPKERADLVDELFASIEASNGQMAKCFYPRHGIIAKRGPDVLELVVAYECYNTRIYLNGEFYGAAEHTKFGRELFDAIGRAHGLKVHGG